ncbi:MAG: serine hydrolase, partial [Bacteroidetes bacterium]|nr:serine hydrolase [Bacteroidota bacterium]
KAFLSANEFSGIILVVKDNKTIIKKAVGFSDLENKILNTIDTKYRIASCSKQFTAIAILQLQEQGKLSVTDKLSKYFPGIAKSDSITIDMLLTHRAGIHNYNADSSYEKLNTPTLTQKQVMKIIESDPSDFSPGSKYQYSNGGYFILGSIIEKVSHQTYDEYIINNIFKIAKMYDSGIDHNETTIPNKAKGYVNKNETLNPAPYDSMEGCMGNGSLYSTANDLYKYYLALNDTILLTKSSRQQFITPARGTYAYGIGVDTLDKHVYIGHGGWVYGFTSQISMYLKDNAFFIVISNTESNVWGLSTGLQAVLFNVPVIYPYKYKEIKVETKSLEKYSGTYGSIKIYIKDNYLHLIDSKSDEGEIKLLPESTTQFFYSGENDRKIEFELDKNNAIIKVWLIDSGLKHELN